MKILLIEDYAPVRKSVTQGLEEAGFIVTSTGDGEEGLWHAQCAERRSFSEVRVGDSQPAALAPERRALRRQRPCCAADLNVQRGLS